MGSKANAPKSTRSIGNKGGAGAGVNPPGEELDEFDLASDIKGRNSLQGDDQTAVASERQAQAGARGETDGLIEGFEKLDKDVRARRDLGKGARDKSARDGKDGS